MMPVTLTNRHALDAGPITELSVVKEIELLL